MFLTRWWSKLKIRNKIFMLTSGLILTVGMVLFATMYAHMPTIYANYKTYEVEQLLTTLVGELDDSSNFAETIFEFSYEHNVLVTVEAQNGKILYPSKALGVDVNMFNRLARISKDNIKVSTDVFMDFINENATVSMITNFRPVDDATTLIVLFVPFMIAIILALSLVLAYINSKFLSRPLVHINEITKKMAGLDFSYQLAVNGEDEIAQLGKSINELSNSLESSINQMKQANLQLKSDIEKERQLESQRREFIATISHELKSPLTIIMGQLEGMKLNIGKYKDHDKYLQESLVVTQNMQQLVNEILSVNKLESTTFKLNSTRINLSELIAEIMSENQYYVAKHQLSVVADIKQDVYVEADMLLLKRALRNIICNAYFYTTGSVKIVLDEHHLAVCNSVDQFPKEELEHLFKPFYRIEKSRNKETGGSGLGLYIVKMILDKHSNLRYELQSSADLVTFEITFN